MGPSSGLTSPISASSGWLRLLVATIPPILMVIVYFVIAAAFGRPWQPSSYQFPLIIAPIFSSGVAGAVLYSAIVQLRKLDGNGNMIALIWSALGFAIVAVICVFLTILQAWHAHLLLMLLLFLYFISWDFCILHLSSADTTYKDEVRTAHRNINAPTIITLLIVFAYLFAVDSNDWWDLRKITKTTSGFGLIEAFTSGVIAFHLGIAGFAYLLTTTGLIDWIMITVNRVLAKSSIWVTVRARGRNPWLWLSVVSVFTLIATYMAWF